MRVAGWGEESDVTVIQVTSHLCCFFPAVKSRCRHVAADLSRPKKSKSCLTAYENKEHRGLVKHEGWDDVNSVRTSGNLESRIGTNQHASAKRAPTEADARTIRRSVGARAVRHDCCRGSGAAQGWGGDRRERQRYPQAEGEAALILLPRVSPTPCKPCVSAP
jgi:hypothetical protein